MTIRWGSYKVKGRYDELIRVSGKPHEAAKPLCDFLRSLTDREIAEYKAAANLATHVMGITFSVYNEEEESLERAWPLDIIPRIITSTDWHPIKDGTTQRVNALNLFIQDIYHEQRIVKDKVLPIEILINSANFREQCMGIAPPKNIWTHIYSADLIRDSSGTNYILEDNVRIPSDVSYMLENRLVMQRLYPDLFEDYNILPIENYSSQLHNLLASLSPRENKKPEIVVLTPGIYDSTYFEHSYLAQQMGAKLVEGQDLYVDEDDIVYMRTIEGLSRVDVIYRCVDELLIDPEVFDSDSTLGVPGLMRAWRSGNVALANPPGTGVADNKLVYSYVPEIIKYYLDEDPTINNVETYRCFNKTEREYVLENIEKLIIKPTNATNRSGMLIGPQASRAECNKFKRLIKHAPYNYIAQTILSLSTIPTLIGNRVESRHLDSKIFILSGNNIQVTNGGLTRVALNTKSTIDHAAQPGISKDTWVIDMEKT